MSTEYKLSYTGVQIDQILKKAEEINVPTDEHINSLIDSKVQNVDEVYVLAEGETIEDAPEDVKMVIDPNGSIESMESVGLTDAGKALILALFRNAAYTADMSEAFTQLEALWSGGGENVGPSGATLTSISAKYSGGSVSVGTAVSALAGIVVTAHYSDGDTADVTGYTLTGTIAEGQNTITVIYGGKSTTFTVTGVAGANLWAVYQLAEETTFDGTNGIDTGITLALTDSDWSITSDVPEAKSGTMFKTHGAIDAQSLRVFNLGDGWAVAVCSGNSNRVKFDTGNAFKFVITHKAGTQEVNVYQCVSGKLVSKPGTSSGGYWKNSNNNPTTLKLASGFIGTVSDFAIYERVLSEYEIMDYLEVSA